MDDRPAREAGAGGFRRHTLERGPPDYATLEMADFDADGDFARGSGLHVAEGRAEKHFLTVWWNETVRSSAASRTSTR